MIRYGKPSGPLIKHKTAFFDENRKRLEELQAIALVYMQQPRRTHCKNCESALGEKLFRKQGIEYHACPNCTHINGAHQDTDAFCKSLYTSDGGKVYGKDYHCEGNAEYFRRLDDVYVPKAEFLADALAEAGEEPASLRFADLGAGSGYFVGALKKCGMITAHGYDVARSQVELGNSMLDCETLTCHDLQDTAQIVSELDSKVVSFLGVLEHLQNPRDVWSAVASNPRIEYMFFSVPLFSPCIFFEMVFPEVMPRQLAGGHTHLYTESSIDHCCNEFGFERLSEWWFGTDMVDLYRSVLVTLLEQNEMKQVADVWGDMFTWVIDDIQMGMDIKHRSSEVHMLLGKRQ